MTARAERSYAGPSAGHRAAEFTYDHPRRAVFSLRGPEDASVRRHDLGADKIVRRQPGEAAERAETAAQAQAGYPRGADEPARNRQAVLLGRGVKLSPR